MPNGSDDPYATSNPNRQVLGELDAGKRAIIDLLYYQSEDGSKYGLIVTGFENNLL